MSKHQPPIAAGECPFVVVDEQPPCAVGVGAVERRQLGGARLLRRRRGPHVVAASVGRTIGAGRKVAIGDRSGGAIAEREVGTGRSIGHDVAHEDEVLAGRSDQHHVEIIQRAVVEVAEPHRDIGREHPGALDGDRGRVRRSGTEIGNRNRPVAAPSPAGEVADVLDDRTRAGKRGHRAVEPGRDEVPARGEVVRAEHGSAASEGNLGNVRCPFAEQDRSVRHPLTSAGDGGGERDVPTRSRRARGRGELGGGRVGAGLSGDRQAPPARSNQRHCRRRR